MKFSVTSEFHFDKIYAGQLITYTVSPALGIALNWMTEITHVKEAEYFIDEQRFGPYSFWHHQHHFRKIDSGVEMTDIVNYKIPLYLIGELMHFVFIKKQLHDIFDYRYKWLGNKFGKIAGV